MATTALGLLCAFQDALSKNLRRWQRRRSLAAQLPTEVQLHIFHYLRTRALFGASERLSDPGPYSSAVVPFSAARDLAAARAVCRAWRDAGTEVLYYDVVLCSAHACIAFAAALRARPHLAPLVKRVVLPEITYQLEHVRRAHWELPISKTGRHPGHRWQDLKDGVACILELCTHASDWTFFRYNAYINAVTGLAHQLPPGRARHLSIRSAHRELQFATDRRQDAFYVSATTARELAHLEALTLHRSLLRVLSAPPAPLAGLHTLRLSTCTMRLDALLTLLSCLPNLRALDWRDSAFADAGDVPLLTLLAAHLATLTECAVIPPEHAPASVQLGDLSPLCALRTLALRADMLPQLEAMPPALQTLVVSFGPWPGYSASRVSLFRVHWRRNIFDAVRALVRAVPDAPALREVQLWDAVLPHQMPAWTVAAFMLHELLAPHGTEVAVNLFLAKDEDVRAKMRWRRTKRRLLWQGIL